MNGFSSVNHACDIDREGILNEKWLKFWVNKPMFGIPYRLLNI